MKGKQNPDLRGGETSHLKVEANGILPVSVLQGDG